MDEIGIEVEFKDITQEPPARAFLEKHVAADRFLEFVSRRSPVFKNRALPASKKEAINLLLEQPNLIKRPILVAGSKVVFGFDKDEYRRVLSPTVKS